MTNFLILICKNIFKSIYYYINKCKWIVYRNKIKSNTGQNNMSWIAILYSQSINIYKWDKNNRN
jgi:hypothetical protein